MKDWQVCVIVLICSHAHSRNDNLNSLDAHNDPFLPFTIGIYKYS